MALEHLALPRSSLQEISSSLGVLQLPGPGVPLPRMTCSEWVGWQRRKGSMLVIQHEIQTQYEKHQHLMRELSD